ncbi:MAG: flagella basal body P-ring formation protein FlgA [Alteromonadaceae bacterium]|jgi:flagella basal body P-ring formation protein FlgA
MVSIDEYFYFPKKLMTKFMIYMKILMILMLATLLTPLRVSAISFDQDYLSNFVQAFVEKNIVPPKKGKMEIKVTDIDPRIKIKPCSSPLQANIPENHNGRNVNVKIYCDDSAPWKMFIPVRIRITIPVLVAITTIHKGTVLDDSNVAIRFKNQSRIRGEVFNDASIVLGAKSKRTISKKTAITRSNICLVCKGESVIITAVSDDFSIKTSGTALKDGSIGDQISVKNHRSGRTVIGKVSSIDHVIINL